MAFPSIPQPLWPFGRNKSPLWHLYHWAALGNVHSRGVPVPRSVTERAGLSHQIPGELVQPVAINSISWCCRQNNGSLNVHTEILETWVILPHMAKRTWQMGLRFWTLILRDDPRLSCWTSLITQVLKIRGSSGLYSQWESCDYRRRIRCTSTCNDYKYPKSQLTWTFIYLGKSTFFKDMGSLGGWEMLITISEFLFWP